MSAGRGPNIEQLRDLLQDRRTHIAIAKITKVVLNSDRSQLRLKLEVWPDERESVGVMGWDFVGDDCGNFTLPVPNELVLVAFAEGDADDCYVIKRLTSSAERIPQQAEGGHTVSKSRAGKKTYLMSDTRICLSSSEDDPEENLVLGQVFKQWASDVLQLIIDHTHTGNLGLFTSPPSNFADFQALKESPIEDDAILSDIAFTEKGGE